MLKNFIKKHLISLLKIYMIIIVLGLDYHLIMQFFYMKLRETKKYTFYISKKTFDESMKFVDDLEKPKLKDTLFIIQLLKENLIFWSSEMNEEKEGKKVNS